jgi:hypothetical protein
VLVLQECPRARAQLRAHPWPAERVGRGGRAPFPGFTSPADTAPSSAAAPSALPGQSIFEDLFRLFDREMDGKDDDAFWEIGA